MSSLYSIFEGKLKVKRKQLKVILKVSYTQAKGKLKVERQDGREDWKLKAAEGKLQTTVNNG